MGNFVNMGSFTYHVISCGGGGGGGGGDFQIITLHDGTRLNRAALSTVDVRRC